ncbi:class I SAM-dependent methyltransferase [Rhizobacter sp. Root1221]|uniref:class I SAM-dependent methyltransferase n=1 Tax=Rhizobacter sp. Root1221 TaxID=1736433 RepID=UPI000AC0D6D4|nr:class I SAM-dependent methyltransferase [Rhizobacter sp. Root1221]
MLTNKRFSPVGQSAFDARFEAQKIAFGPVVFQCVRLAWKHGMLDALSDAGDTGRSIDELAGTGRWTAYVLKVVLESCLSAGVVSRVGGRYVLDKAGYCVLSDAVTQTNFDFMHDVCYLGLHQLDEALRTGKPAGLATLGPWPTLYEGMADLPEPARTSWFAFDHLYSDTSFPSILPDVFATAPKRLMDIGANTGKFSLAALSADPAVELHLVDLPRQLAVARDNVGAAGHGRRAHYHPTDLLDPHAALPQGMDVVWMSQFLSCFSEAAIATILQRAAGALAPGGQVLVLDTLWDTQRYDIAAYCLINTSPYFTAMASGNSKVYERDDYVRLAEEAGLRLVTSRDGIGYCHTLLRFAKVAP